MHPAALKINPELEIPLAEITVHFSRSGGPGGQHVNRTESKVELRFDIRNSPSLNEAQREMVLGKLKSYVDNQGILHLVAQVHRSQLRNRAAALKRFLGLMQNALRPEKHRKPSKPSKASVERRLAGKRRRSRLKQHRAKPDDRD